MDLSTRTETFLQDAQDWLGSEHGTSSTKTVTLDKSLFTSGTHFPDGALLSGIALGKVTSGGKYGPYDDAANDGRQVLAGFLYTAVPIRSTADVDPAGAILLHGMVIEAKLPLAGATSGTAGKVDSNGKADVVGFIKFL